MKALLNGTLSRRWCMYASILLILYGCLLATKSISGFPVSHNTHTRWPWLGDKPVGEDGFYMLTVADNLARTGHLVYNYNLPATGIQPLATFVFAGIAYCTDHFGGDRWTLVRWVLLFGVLLFVVFAWQLAYIAADLAPPDLKSLVFQIAFFLTLFDYTAFRLFTYGLETGIYLVCIAICMKLWLHLTDAPQASWLHMLLFGAAAGLAGLARIDFGIFTAFLLGYLLLKRIASLPQVLAAGGVALAIVSPWFLFVHKVTGSWLPTSGKAESSLYSHDFGRIHAAIMALLASISPWSYADAESRSTTIFACLSACLVLLLIWRARKSPASFSSFRRLGIFKAWLPPLIAFVLIYVIFFFSKWFYTRYFSPLLIVSIPFLAVLFATQRFVRERPQALLLAIACLFCLFDTPSMHSGHVVLDHLMAAGYIHENYPVERVGAFQSGAIGYFDPNVENLDGKLNQHALAAAAANRMGDFIDSERIDVLVDWPGFLIGHLPEDYRNREWQACPQPMPVSDSMCLIRKYPFTPIP